MTDLELLGQMIKNNARVPLTFVDRKATVVLYEPQDPGVSVTISGIPDNAVVIKVDAFKSPDTIFSGTKGECKRADFVIIANTVNKKVIVYIEMKKNKSSRTEVTEQLTGALCFIRYCQEIGRCFWKEKEFLKNYKNRFISLGHISIAKRRTRIDRSYGKHDSPEKMMRIDWPRKLQFNHLAGI